MMKRILILSFFILHSSFFISYAQTSPDGRLSVKVACNNGKPSYSVLLDGKVAIEESALGLMTNLGDFTQGLTLSKTSDMEKVETDYKLYNIKRLNNHVSANKTVYTFAKDGKDVMTVTFVAENNNIAFQYEILRTNKETMCCVVNNEATQFTLPSGTTTFMCPQMGEMTGFARTAPSYETHYTADEEMGKNGWGNGYTFPCLFKTTHSPLPTSPGGGEDLNSLAGSGKSNVQNISKISSPRGGQEGAVWVLISETGSAGNYPGCKLENKGAGTYQISFPSEKENNGYGSTGAQLLLPDHTPWRTLTISDNLKDIVETTITWDVLAAENQSLLSASPGGEEGLNTLADITNVQNISKDSPFGGRGASRGAWSWIIANDESCNFDTQKQYIDFAAAMGWESLLVDAMWDSQIGYERIAELAKYGKSKGVALYLWYNSNGLWNDAPQGPRNCMDTPYRRQAEMEWMKEIGIRGIKVDFFGGDKQCTMQLYRDILKDAEKYGIYVIFHGCTLPRGWEYMFPNYVASEAVRASENLHFGQNECDREAMDATFLPFIRNTVGSMDFGGSTLNWYYNPKNSKEMWGGHRVTSDVFALATAVLFQSPVQHFAMAPNNLTDAPSWAVDFMKTVPTTWEDIRYIDGYPGKYIVLARKSQEGTSTGLSTGKWYISAVNGQKEAIKVTIPLDMFGVGKTVTMYSDDAKLQGSKKPLKVSKKQQVTVTIPVNGACLICE